MHTCNNCGKIFKSAQKLVRHNNRKTPCRSATHHCDKCPKGFTNYQSLWQHKQKCQAKCGSKRDVPPFIEETQPALTHHPFYTPVKRKRSRDIADQGDNRFRTDKSEDLSSKPKNSKIEAMKKESLSPSSSGCSY